MKRAATESPVQYVWVSYWYNDYRKENDAEIINVFTEKQAALDDLLIHLRSHMTESFAGQLVPYTDEEDFVMFCWEHDDKSAPSFMKPTIFCLKQKILV
jgi:hypothetical protein